MTATMPRPGSVVRFRSGVSPRNVPTATGPWFMAGLSDRGPLAATPIKSLQDFITTFGARQTYSVLYDAVETYFREGGVMAIISRVVGPGAALSSRNLLDASAGTSLVISAKGPGAYAQNITVAVQNPGAGGTASSFSLTITDPNAPNGALTEQSPDFTTNAQAVAWSQTSQLVNLALGASALLPAALAAGSIGTTTTGTDDRVNITDAQWRTALGRFTKDMGPGQVTQVGRTTNQAYIDTLTHAAATGRTAILDLPDSPTPATLTSATTALRNQVDTSGNPLDTFGGAFGPWVVIPGLTPNTTRIVPPSALVCGRIAASDASGNSPNQPAAGFPEGVANYVIGLSQPAYDNGSGIAVTRDAMYALGVNLIVSRYGVVEVFGWRTLVDTNGIWQDWTNLANRRLAMAMTAESNAIMENYILKEIDGAGRLFSKMKGQVQAMCGRYYALGSLYDGGSGVAEDAYYVDTGSNVNTPATIANREAHVAIACRMAEDAELVVFEIAKIPVSQSLSTT
jgi:hypothetical protein